MSEISINIPVSLLPKGMSIEDAITQLSQAGDAAARVEDITTRYNTLVGQVASAGNSLELILDEVNDEWHRVQALRNFARELKTLSASVRKIP